MNNIYILIILYIIWIILTSSLTLESLTLGLMITLLIGYIDNHDFSFNIVFKKAITKFVYLLQYGFWVYWEMLEASYKVSYHILDPRTKFKSGVVKVPTKVSGNHEQVQLIILANTITLTPGTVTLDLNLANKELYILWLNVKAKDYRTIRKIILLRFEMIIRRIFK
ncbi:MAG: Na+/H+ antiporter subunit E [Bacillota bacterium]